MLAESASLIDAQTHKQSCLVKSVIGKKLVVLVMKTVQKSPEVEFLHFATQIINHAIGDKELRAVVIQEPLKTMDQIQPTDEVEVGKVFNYASLLKSTIEKMPEVVSIRKLHQRVVRQRKELEFWAAATK